MAQAKGVSTTIRELMLAVSPRSLQVRCGGHTPNWSQPSPGMCRTRSMPMSISEDLDGRADYLEEVFASLHVYVASIIADTTGHIPGGTLDRRYLDNLFEDLSADALGSIRNAAEEMRKHQNWRASMTLPFETAPTSPKRLDRRGFIGGSDARIIMGER